MYISDLELRMLTDPINRTLEIDSHDAAASGCSHEEQTRRCDATVGKACAVLGLGTLCGSAKMLVPGHSPLLAIKYKETTWD